MERAASRILMNPPRIEDYECSLRKKKRRHPRESSEQDAPKKKRKAVTKSVTAEQEEELSPEISAAKEFLDKVDIFSDPPEKAPIISKQSTKEEINKEQ